MCDSQQKLPLECRWTKRLARTVKRTQKLGSRTEKRFGFEVGPSRMLGWPENVSRDRVKWEISGYMGNVVGLFRRNRVRALVNELRSVSPPYPATRPAIERKSDACKELGRLKAIEAIDVLIQTIRNDERYSFYDSDHVHFLRDDAANALSDLGAKAVGPLIEVLNDTEPDVRRLSAQALGAIGDQRALEPLIEGLRDRNSGARHSVARALSQLGGERVVAVLSEALGESDMHLRLLAANTLGVIGDRQAFAPLT